VTTLGAVRLAGALGHMNVVSFAFDVHSRYNFWSGITGGFFLAMAYFGTDQSQVQRYLSGRSVTESRLGLLFNGLFKVPMQFVVLFIGVMVFVFYLFVRPPIFFNAPTLARVAAGPHAAELAGLEHRFDEAHGAQATAAEAFVEASPEARPAAADRLRDAAGRVASIRAEAKTLVKRALPGAETKDADYVFLSFVLRYVPSGLVGLLIAVILCASMSASSSELSALGSTTTVDLFKRLRPRPATAHDDLVASKLFTAAWGVAAVSFASFAAMLDNLIQAVNILGSIFYGTILGLFTVAFFLRRITATPVLIGALVAQTAILILFFASDIGFLWYNVIGCALVVCVSSAIEWLRPGDRTGNPAPSEAAQR
jgi:Na+/proline symporter